MVVIWRRRNVTPEILHTREFNLWYKHIPQSTLQYFKDNFSYQDDNDMCNRASVVTAFLAQEGITKMAQLRNSSHCGDTKTRMCQTWYHIPLIWIFIFSETYRHIEAHFTPPAKSLASLLLAGQLVVMPPLKWPFIQEYDTEYFQISYDKC